MKSKIGAGNWDGMVNGQTPVSKSTTATVCPSTKHATSLAAAVEAKRATELAITDDNLIFNYRVVVTL